MDKLIVICGPTASGKTALAIDLAKKFNGEIVSADSRQIYRGMDIGTAKPILTKNNLASGIPHYLIDIKNPNQDYAVGQYKKDAIRAINSIIKSGKLPFLVGGTGLYISAITKNLTIPTVKADEKLRKNLEKEISLKGLDFVFKKLVKLDPEAAYIVDPKNPRRVIRALEIALKTKKPFSSQRRSGQPLYQILELGLNPNPEKLKLIITKRIEIMLEGGLVEEVKKLVKKYGYKPKAFDAIGYREIIDYLDKKIPLEEAESIMAKNTWHYARRQMTWLRKDKDIIWLPNNSIENSKRQAIKLIQEFLAK
jgi:tRNA dimethylallyltransferase